MDMLMPLVAADRAPEHSSENVFGEGEEEDMAMPADMLHQPVMLQEALDFLCLREGSVVVDATLGLGGHAAAVLARVGKSGRLVAIDKDVASLEAARLRLKKFSKTIDFVHEDFRNIDRVLESCGVERVDAFLFDLGISSFQLDDPGRGFSFKAQGPLDMRLDQGNFITAYDLLNNLTEEEISSILWKFGEERFARRIARGIVMARRRAPLSSTVQLAEAVASCLPPGLRHGRIHPATRTFQALRIAVNRELDALEEALKKAAAFLKKGGRMCVISFHSLEDRIVKENFRALSREGGFRLVVKKVVRPSEAEVAANPRSRSAKMRVLERVS